MPPPIRYLVPLSTLAFSLGFADTSPSPLRLYWPEETALFALGWAGDIVGQQRLTDLSPAGPGDLRRAELAPWDRFAAGWNNPVAARASDVTLAAVGGAMVGLDGWLACNGSSAWNAAWEDGTILLEGFAWSSALSLNVRAWGLHPRPLAYGSDARARDREAPEAAGSFFSGHAAGAFLGATYLATVVPLRYPGFQHPVWLWTGSLAAASVVAGLRVAAGKHYVSDVVAGAAVGSLLGWILPQIHRNPDSPWSRIHLLPTRDGAGVQIVCNFFGQSQAGARMARSAASTSMGREK